MKKSKPAPKKSGSTNAPPFLPGGKKSNTKKGGK